MLTSFSGLFGTLYNAQADNVIALATVYENYNLSGKSSYLFAGSLGDLTWGTPIRKGFASLTAGHVGRVVDVYLQCAQTTTCTPGQYADSRLRVGSMELTLDDQVNPTPQQVTGSLFSGGWKRGRQTMAFRSTDSGSGLYTLTANLSNSTSLASPAGCQKVGGYFGAPTPCPLDRTASWTVDTAAQLADGEHSVTFRAEDVGGRAANSSVRTFKVDNHAPGAPLSASVAGGSGWRSNNGFDLSWTKPAPEHAPIVAAHWKACPAGRTTGCTTGKASSTSSAQDVTVPTPGEWDVRVWLEDEAGNGNANEAANSSAPVRLRWDPQGPALTFRAPDPNEPTVAAVDARDVSGVANGTIEIGRVGGSGWQTLRTSHTATTLEAVIPDESLPAGDYLLRAHATDAAGNEGSAQGPSRSLPIRFETRIRAAALTRVRVRGKRRSVRRTSVKVRYGRKARITGTLAARDGQRLRRRVVEVTFLPSVGRARRLTSTRTDDSGSLRYSFKAKRSGVLAFRYPGDRRILPSQQRVRIAVPAPISIHTRDGLLFNGEAATFYGLIRGGAIPTGGKLVEIQAYFRRAWRTISTTRSDRRGRWRFAYTFGGTTGTVRYRFRARVPREGGYPFAVGASRAAKVTVRGL